MTQYQFSTTPDICIGAGSSKRTGELASALGMKHALIVCDPDIKSLGLLDQALESLENQKVKISIYSDVIADPPEHIVTAAAAEARMAGCDGVIGLGGGSSLDTAKLVAALIIGDQTLSEMYGVDQVRGKRAPLIQIPTTAGTGSEVTMVAIVTTGGTTKAGVVSRTLLADKVILDPVLTKGLPPHITAATGIDAMVHAIEAYTSVRLKNPLSDMLARQALELMCGSIQLAVKDGSDMRAREAMLLGAMLAGQAFANAPVAAVHALAYPLGGNYHIAHGLSNSLVLPHVLRFNAKGAAELYHQLAPIILGDAPLAGNARAVTEQLAQHFHALAAELGLQTSLREMNIAESDLDMLAGEAMLQERLLINNPRPMTHADALGIYQQAY
ncbi:MAG: iron-containing alcohol dehydrogenase [Pseudomonadales bacterium]